MEVIGIVKGRSISILKSRICNKIPVCLCRLILVKSGKKLSYSKVFDDYAHKIERNEQWEVLVLFLKGKVN